jgi:methionyl-tRNA formyltransferase
MRIIFFGSGEFAVTILEALDQAKHQVVLVVTQPDRKKGRHLHLGATPVKEYALNHELKLFQPEDINLAQSQAVLEKEDAQVFVVVSYGKILSRKTLSLPCLMPINIHASLLPKYRGAAPINRALINNEKKTGVTFIRMNEHTDQGDILFQKAVKIEPDENVRALDQKLSQLAARHANEVLKAVESKKIRPKKQNEKKATYAPLLKKQDGLIQWAHPAKDIYNNFRGCFGWPGSFTYYRRKLLKVFDMAPCRHKTLGRPGEIISAKDNVLEVACGVGAICLKEVLPESHKRMPVSSFLTGHHVCAGDFLEPHG